MLTLIPTSAPARGLRGILTHLLSSGTLVPFRYQLYMTNGPHTQEDEVTWLRPLRSFCRTIYLDEGSQLGSGAGWV
jgi:hypothetical protein